MPRQARIDFPGALHHVISRGIEHSFIFKEDEDKKEMLRRFRRILQESDVQCYAWCIMGNHFHILLQTGQTSLSEIMRRLLTGYAIYYNRKNKRVGHLFQNRYKSIICDKDEYFLPLIRYIHLNPVKARIIEYDELKKFIWSGHYELLKRRKDSIINRDEVLYNFGRSESDARKEYLKFVRSGIEVNEDLSGGGLVRSSGGISAILKNDKKEKELYDERILGCGDFVTNVLERLEVDESSILRNKRSLKTIDTLLSKLSKYYDVEKEMIISTRVKRVVNARRLFIYFGSQYFDKSLTEMGRILGISQQAASYAYQKGRELELKENISASIF